MLFFSTKQNIYSYCFYYTKSNKMHVIIITVFSTVCVFNCKAFIFMLN